MITKACLAIVITIGGMVTFFCFGSECVRVLATGTYGEGAGGIGILMLHGQLMIIMTGVIVEGIRELARSNHESNS